MTTPGGQGRFQGYDVLAQRNHWDEVTQGVVLRRLGPPAPLRFFTEPEGATARALLDRLLGQDDEPRVGLHGEMQLYAAPVLAVRRAPEVAGVDGSVDEFGGAVAAQGELVGNHDRAWVVLRVGVHGQQQVVLDVGEAELAGACLALALEVRELGPGADQALAVLGRRWVGGFGHVVPPGERRWGWGRAGLGSTVVVRLTCRGRKCQRAGLPGSAHPGSMVRAGHDRQRHQPCHRGPAAVDHRDVHPEPSRVLGASPPRLAVLVDAVAPMAGAYLADRPSARSAGAVPARRAGRGGAGMTGPRFVPATGQQR